MHHTSATFEFYKSQIILLTKASFKNDIQGIGTAAFSFFEGKQHSLGEIAQLSANHITSMFTDQQLIEWNDQNPQTILKWIEGLYFYFRSMAAIPEVADELWPYVTAIANKYRQYEDEYLGALCQLASWDFSYKKLRHQQCLDYIKSLRLTSKKTKTVRNLFLSTSINKDSSDFIKNIASAYKNRAQLSHHNLAISIINYYCMISQDEKTLDELIKILKGPNFKNRLNQESTDFLKPLIWELFDKAEYGRLLRFLRALKSCKSEAPFTSAHAFLLCNSEHLVIQGHNWLDTFETSGNYDSYKTLIAQSNKATNTFISLLGESTDTDPTFDSRRKGAPPIDDDLESLAIATISHLRLEDPIYSQLNLLTLTPSHNFPIQSSLFKLGKKAPIISTSLEELLEESETKKFIFFLSSLVAIMPIEESYIKAEFGANAKIIIDPTPADFVSSMTSGEYNVFYISCHGEYSHWGDGSEDNIVFSETSKISIQTIVECSAQHHEKRNIILNICDGATSTISCIPYNRGMASSFARGHQTVISHLWPVSSVYACAFGLLTLHFLKTLSAIETAQETFNILNSENPIIIRKTGSLSPALKILATYLSRADFNMNEFKNIGSVAIYS
ncbi:hypothetical protein PUP72_19615 [Pseudomonas synxantha]|uniref:hypothetical protein n=1 Tax=Pseudomonas synxantha TaxID=47883 RepID=UPI002367E097|nr:hypothetical protein [Pseudomonas synxantha]WDG40840.1 hypothetical protein PUP72_19615 [Pseudomonas synxantha]